MTPIIKSQIYTGDNGEGGDKESPEGRNSELVAIGAALILVLLLLLLLLSLCTAERHS